MATAETEAMAAEATVPSAAPVAPSRVIDRVSRLLVQTPDGLHFPPGAQEKIAVLIEVAARLKDRSRAEAALLDLIRLMSSLAAEGHLAASQALRSMLKGSAAALRVLSGTRRGKAEAFARFQPTHGVKGARHAPRVDAPPADRGVVLRELFPSSAGRLEPGARKPSK